LFRHAEPQQQRIASQERRERRSGLHELAVCTLRVWMMPATGARTKASCWSSSACCIATRACDTSAAAVRTLVRQLSISSAGMMPVVLDVAVSRRSRPACASACAAVAFSSAARAASTASAKRWGSISTKTRCGSTRSPSAKRTASTTPETRAVTVTISKASTEPTALTR
jgi:hypothetical protein